MFGFNSFSIGQKQTEKEIKALLCCKWKVSSFQPLGGEIKKASGYNVFMTFSSDGSLLKVDPGIQYLVNGAMSIGQNLSILKKRIEHWSIK